VPIDQRQIPSGRGVEPRDDELLQLGGSFHGSLLIAGMRTYVASLPGLVTAVT
jgi:hypothetical protein